MKSKQLLTRAKYKIKGYAANMKGYKWCPDRILQQPYKTLQQPYKTLQQPYNNLTTDSVSS